ncbi:substrate-binding periplasmic protein [Rhodoferax aquaticus]|uniref:Transporter substrate-binding domain-containing protein n=1 Tax=Rhodoferax aquaticus TaxID=2527691 RepID=A0A515EQ32_9BURK|nr:transporter substrate-binding domain-containing protein [Rhodoferax aquaticus]QDL54778.1 transporter substrate-binding domain-containing protein [Rhodoferax aquaticus]
MNLRKKVALFFVGLLGVSSNSLGLSFVTEDYPPFAYVTDYGYLSGSSYQIIDEMLKRTRLAASVKVYPWARAYRMARDGKDVCVFTAARTKDLEEQFKWVGPLSTDSWTLFARADSQIFANTLSDARIYKIGAVNESAQATFLKSNGFAVDTASSEDLNLRKLSLGRFDLWAVGSASGKWLAKKHGVPIKKVMTFREVAVYLACNPSVASSAIVTMNDAIRRMKADGFIDKVLRLYQ